MTSFREPPPPSSAPEPQPAAAQPASSTRELRHAIAAACNARAAAQHYRGECADAAAVDFYCGAITVLGALEHIATSSVTFDALVFAAARGASGVKELAAKLAQPIEAPANE